MIKTNWYWALRAGASGAVCIPVCCPEVVLTHALQPTHILPTVAFITALPDFQDCQRIKMCVAAPMPSGIHWIYLLEKIKHATGSRRLEDEFN